jgi:hypothetical protein
VETAIFVVLAVGLLAAVALLGWAAAHEVRRHGFRRAARAAVRGYVSELPLYWRSPIVAWMLLVALPVIGIWATATEGFDAAGAVVLAVLWLLALALLRWHLRARRRARR